ncbi:MAG: TlpA family protein disulfide reductase [Acidimicrobiia bacterium]
MPTSHAADVFPEPEPLAPARGRLTLVFLLVIAIGLVVAQAFGSTETGAAGQLGGVAPEVVVELFDGDRWTLSEHLTEDGRPLVLNLWASWCLPCREEIPELSAFAAARPDVAVIGVAVNDVEDDARALTSELQPGYPVGMDATGRLRDRYPSPGMPFTVIIDSQGVIRWSYAGGVTADQLSAALDDLG